MAAALETDDAKLPVRIEAAESALQQALVEVDGGRQAAADREEMVHALHALKVLKQERLDAVPEDPKRRDSKREAPSVDIESAGEMPEPA